MAALGLFSPLGRALRAGFPPAAELCEKVGEDPEYQGSAELERQDPERGWGGWGGAELSQGLWPSHIPTPAQPEFSPGVPFCAKPLILNLGWEGILAREWEHG